MFVPLPDDQSSKIKRAGYLTLVAASRYNGPGNVKKHKHYIIFASKGEIISPMNLFHCLVTTTRVVFAIEDVTIDPAVMNVFSESEMHMLTGWFFQTAPVWALSHGKKMLFIKTKIPHCTEWMIEYGYNVTYANKTDDSIGFRGSGLTRTLMANTTKP